MNKSQLLILGNGFDLHCGLKSSYKDFFRSSILDVAGERFGLSQLQAGVTGFWEELLLQYYKINNKDDYEWCDIERIIKDTLQVIFVEGDHSYFSARGLYNRIIVALRSIKDIEADAQRIDNPIHRYIFLYCVKFLNEHQSELSPAEKRELLLKHILDSLYDLEKRFCKYLRNQMLYPALKEKYIVNAANLLARLTSSVYHKFDDLFDIIDPKGGNHLTDFFEYLTNVFVINFNYTAFFDILLVESPCMYNNVHGKLCSKFCADECDKSSIIFGIDDNIIQSQGVSSELRLFSKTYRKMFNNGDPIIILPPNDGSEIKIKFYGHSLSEADYSYFQSIFDYYDLYGNSNVSLIFYYSKGYEQHDAIYRLISEYGKSLTNKEQGKNLIHKLLLENRLKIQEIKDSRIFECGDDDE